MTPRAYASPLRDEQVELTRERIMAATAAVLAGADAQEVTISRIALQAGVSLRTVYRHYPTKEALFDAFGEWAEEHFKLRVHSYPETLEGLRSMAPDLYRSYDANESLVRALLSPHARELRARTRRRRLVTFERAMTEVTKGLSKPAQRRALAVLYLLVSAPAWRAMREQWGLDGEEGGKAAAWAVRVLTDELRTNPESIELEPEGGTQ